MCVGTHLWLAEMSIDRHWINLSTRNTVQTKLIFQHVGYHGSVYASPTVPGTDIGIVLVSPMCLGRLVSLSSG